MEININLEHTWLANKKEYNSWNKIQNSWFTGKHHFFNNISIFD